PGAALRSRAQEILEEARRQLREAGDSAAGTLQQQAGQGGDSPGWLSKASDIATTAIEDLHTGTTDLTLSNGSSGPVTNDLLQSWGDHDPNSSDLGTGIDWKVQLGEFNGEASLWGVDAHGETQFGDLGLGGSADFDVLGVQGNSGLSIDGDGLTAELYGRA